MVNTYTIHTRGFRKLIDTFRYFVESPLCPQASEPIHIGIWSRIPPIGRIIYNTEQLSRPEMLRVIKNIIKKSNPLEIWDYSLANIHILKNNNILARHVPLESPGWYVKELQSYRKDEQEYDVGFSGWMSPRRLKILNKLKASGLSVNIVANIFGKERDKELAKCKIILNIHASPEYKIFESNRCEPWLKAGVRVISENSLDNDDRCINVKYSDIVKTVQSTLNRKRRYTRRKRRV